MESESLPLMYCVKKIGRRFENYTLEDSTRTFKHNGKIYESLIDDDFQDFRADIRVNKDFNLKAIQPAEEEGTEYLALFLIPAQYEIRNIMARVRLLTLCFGNDFLDSTELEVLNQEDIMSYISATEQVEFISRLYELLRKFHSNDVLGESVADVIEHPSLKPTLRPYQIRAVKWLLNRELNKRMISNNYIKLYCEELPDEDFYLHPRTLHLVDYKPKDVQLPSGGILADEMGLGKTVEMLCLILMNNRQNTRQSNLIPDDEYIVPSKKRKPNSSLYCTCVAQSTRKTIKCSICNQSQHIKCVRKFSKSWHDPKDYICPKCWEQRSLIESAATIIVSPQTIKMQWYEEIIKHTIEQPKVFIYDGIFTKGWISPEELAEYDIVLTDYDTLKKEIYSLQTNSINLRHSQRYMRLPSPLMRIHWWRVCLDEAQLVESSTTNAAKMVKILPTVHRWAVTGTPIQKSISDLQGLLEFLNLERYSSNSYFSSLLASFRKNNTEPLINVLGEVMWRTCKSTVLNEIGIPPQTEEVHYVQMCDAQKLFYSEQHISSAVAFEQKANSLTSFSMSISQMNPRILKLILEPLKKLRQDCSVPFLLQKSDQSVTKKFLKPKQLLEHLKSTNEIESKTQLRTIVSHINGIAGCHFLRGEFADAVHLYESVLRRAKEYTGTISVDTLLQIHALYNMVAALEAINTGDNINVEKIKEYSDECFKLEWKYIENYKSNIKNAEISLNLAKNSVDEIKQKFGKNFEGNWWGNLLHRIKKKNYEQQLINRVNDETRIVGEIHYEFRMVEGINYRITKWFKDVKESRSNVLKYFNIIKNYVKYIKPQNELTSAEKQEFKKIIRTVFDCHLYKKNDNKENVSEEKTTNPCDLCKADKARINYECLIYNKVRVFRENNDITEGSWNPTVQETIVKILHSFAKVKNLDKDEIYMGDVFLQMLESMKKEYKEFGKFWIELEYVIKAYDELDMCKLRLETVDPQELSMLHNKTNKTLNKIFIDDVEATINDLQNQLQLAEMDFVRKMARLRYITHLENDYNPGVCPICKLDPTNEYVVLECGHHICIVCLEQCKKFHRSNLTCSVCRNTQSYKSVYYVTRDLSKNPKYADLKGEHSAKIREIVQTVLRLRNIDEHVKIIIFSYWDSILRVVANALAENEVKYISKTNYKGIEHFKDARHDVTCLLMPLSRGAQGLNLIEATHVFLVEPILNPGEELQAIGRVHRLGQTRPTTVHRFIVRNTIEETIFDTIRNDKTGKWENRDITVENLRILFSRDI